jgi:hypothetical protein
MRRKILLITGLLLMVSLMPVLSISSPRAGEEIKDSIGRQILYNGRAWRNLYYNIQGDQFLFTADFLPGTITINGKKFSDLHFKYDIFNDELILSTDHAVNIQLNKEMVDRFTFNYLGRTYIFKNLVADSTNSLSGYVNVLYDGKTSLYVKYRKEILLLAVDNKYDIFNQINKMYLENNGVITQINNKKRLLGLLSDHNEEMRAFIKSNKIHLSRKDPDGYIPVVEYYNRITK